MSLLEQSIAYKPFKYVWATELAIEHDTDLHWHEGEANLQPDVDQWKMGIILPEEKEQITQILRLFTQSDVVVGKNYLECYIPRFKNNEIRMMLTSFANREFVHQRAYALLNDTLGLSEAEYSAYLDSSSMKNKVEFMEDIDASTQSGLGLGLVRSVINEGVGLFSAFAMLLAYQRTGKMRGMSEIVEWSVRDETLHCIAMIRLFREYCQEHPRIVNDDFKRSIYDMFRREVVLEDRIIDNAMGEQTLAGITAGEVKQYIRYLADRRLIQLGMKSNWHVRENPLPWLDWVISGDSFKNFFEGRVTDYSAAGMTGDFGWTKEVEM